MRSSLLLWLLCPVTLFAQQITFKAAGGQGQPIRIMEPINGNFFMAAWRTDTLDANGEITFPNRSKTPGTYEFGYKKIHRLYVKPGQSYTIHADKETDTLLNFEFYQTVGMRYYKEDTSYAHNKAKVLTALSERLALLKKKDQNAEKFIKIYYANLLASTFMYPMMALEFNKDSARYDAQKIQTVHGYWQDVFAIADPHDNASMHVSTYYDYVNFYNTWYLGYFQPGEKGTYVRPTKEDEYWTRKYADIQSSFKEPLREYLTATWIYVLTMENGFQPFILDWYNDFSLKYPKSVYTSSLVAGVNKVKEYQDKVKQNFTAAQQFVEGYADINSFEELASRFKDKTVYVDIWATWCGPCKEEFEYNSGLKKKNIQVLYISIDNESADKQWKEMIRYYDLQGYHIRTSAKLLQDIRKIFGTNRGLAIPRYAIIKNGKMVINNAKRPSDKEALYKQIEEVIK